MIDMSVLSAMAGRKAGTALAMLRAPVLALGMGILAVSVAPLLASRRLRRMDVPGTLRVVE